MITISWATLVGFFGLVALVGPVGVYVGRMSKQVDHNTGAIEKLDGKIDVIHEYVKNGGRRNAP